MRGCACLALLALVVAAGGCGPTVDLTKGLQIEHVSTGWFDAGIKDGKNKLVPSITFTVKNVSDQKLPVLQINAVFRRINEPNAEWGTNFVSVVGSEGLAPGATAGPLTIRSPLGYTGSDQTREEMLHNSQFVDAKVDLQAKYGSAQWTKVGDFPIERKLIVK
jgi:hypothetical protein